MSAAASAGIACSSAMRENSQNMSVMLLPENGMATWLRMRGVTGWMVSGAGVEGERCAPDSADCLR